MDIFNNFPSSFKCLGALSQVFDFEFMMGLARECGLVVRRRKIQPLPVLKAFPDEGDGKCSVSISAVWRRRRLLAGIASLPLVSGTAFFNFVAKGTLGKFFEEFGLELGKRLGDSAFTDTDGKGGLKVHAAWSLSKGTLESSSITSAVSSERDEIQMDRVKGSLIICDAGYPSIELFGKLQDQGALMLFKMRSSMKPSVLKCSAFSNGKYEPAVDFGGECAKLKDDPRLGGQRPCDCVVSFARKGRTPLAMRVARLFNPRYCGADSSPALAGHEELTPLDGHCFLATNIPASQLDADQLYALYRLRPRPSPCRTAFPWRACRARRTGPRPYGRARSCRRGALTRRSGMRARTRRSPTARARLRSCPQLTPAGWRHAPPALPAAVLLPCCTPVPSEHGLRLPWKPS